MKSRLLEINRMINRFQVDFEGKKISVMESPDFKAKWAAILETQSQQSNGRRLFMQLYFHPIMGSLRVAKWLPKRNVCDQDQVFLTQMADDLRFDDGTFVIEGGPHEGHYRKVTDIDCISSKTTKIETSTNNDSGFCPNCSASFGQNQTDPDFVEIDFTESDSEYEQLAEQARKARISTSTKIDSAPEASNSSSTDMNNSVSPYANDSDRRKCLISLKIELDP